MSTGSRGVGVWGSGALHLVDIHNGGGHIRDLRIDDGAHVSRCAEVNLGHVALKEERGDEGP